jgi:hypothetical protein
MSKPFDRCRWVYGRHPVSLYERIDRLTGDKAWNERVVWILSPTGSDRLKDIPLTHLTFDGLT